MSAVSTVVSKTTSVGSNPAAPVYLRSIMEECNGLLIRRLQVRILSQILWQRTLIGKRLAWKASVAVKRDEGSSPFAVVRRCKPNR